MSERRGWLSGTAPDSRLKDRGSIPGRSSFQSQLSVLTYFGIRSTPCTAAVRKDPGHSTKVTAKHASTLPMWLPLTL